MPVTGSEHVHEIPLSVDSAPIITEGPQQGDYDNVYPLEDVHFATLAEKKRLWLRDALINSLFIASWYVKAYSANHFHLTIVCRFTFAIILSLYNKWMFAPEHFGFPFPLLVTMLHMFVQALLASILRFGWPRRFRPEHNPSREDFV